MYQRPQKKRQTSVSHRCEHFCVDTFLLNKAFGIKTSRNASVYKWWVACEVIFPKKKKVECRIVVELPVWRFQTVSHQSRRNVFVSTIKKIKKCVCFVKSCFPKLLMAGVQYMTNPDWSTEELQAVRNDPKPPFVESHSVFPVPLLWIRLISCLARLNQVCWSGENTQFGV